MKKICYRFREKEYYDNLVINLNSESEKGNEKIGYIGAFTETFGKGPIMIRQFFILDNGATIIGGFDHVPIALYVRDKAHAEETKTLLSRLTKIPQDKFILYKSR